MDKEITEQAVAALLAEEAAQLRRAAGFQGYSAFLQKPSVRARPNKQFLAATVRSVESANRMAQVSEMWQLRKKELSEEEGSDGRGRNSIRSKRETHHGKSSIDSQGRHKKQAIGGTELTRERRVKDYHQRDMRSALESLSDGSSSPDKIRSRGDRSMGASERPADNGAELVGPPAPSGEDDDLDDFLNSRRKRGRGAVGSRMDEPGPFAAVEKGIELEERETSARSPVMLGPQLPPQLEVLRKKRKDNTTQQSNLDNSGATAKEKRRHGSKEERRARKEARRKRRKERDKSQEKQHSKRSRQGE